MTTKSTGNKICICLLVMLITSSSIRAEGDLEGDMPLGEPEEFEVSAESEAGSTPEIQDPEVTENEEASVVLEDEIAFAEELDEEGEALEPMDGDPEPAVTTGAPGNLPLVLALAAGLKDVPLRNVEATFFPAAPSIPPVSVSRESSGSAGFLGEGTASASVTRGAGQTAVELKADGALGVEAKGQGAVAIRAGSFAGKIEAEGEVQLGARGKVESRSSIGPAGIESSTKGEGLAGFRARGSVATAFEGPGDVQGSSRLDGKVLAGAEGSIDHSITASAEGVDIRNKGSATAGLAAEITVTNQLKTPLGSVSSQTTAGASSGAGISLDQQLKSTEDELAIRNNIRVSVGDSVSLESKQTLASPRGSAVATSGYVSPGHPTAAGNLEISRSNSSGTTKVGAGVIIPFAVSVGGNAELTVKDDDLKAAVRIGGGPIAGRLAEQAVTPVMNSGAQAVNQVYRSTVAAADTVRNVNPAILERAVPGGALLRTLFR